MKTIAILYIGRHPEITETVVRLLNTNENWVGVGTVNDEEAKAIFELCNAKTKIIFDFYVKGLRGFLAVLSQCDALVGNEGGATNMSKALNIPTFTIYAPWINRTSWNIFEETGLHEIVHLSDYFPDLYKNKHPKNFKEKALEWYDKLNPELFTEKLQKFVVAACKQSATFTFPIVHQECSFNEFIQKYKDNNLLIGHCSDSFSKLPLHQVLNTVQPVVLIGPEGDFSEREIEKVYQLNGKGVHLTHKRLRTETAAVVACHSIVYSNE